MNKLDRKLTESAQETREVPMELAVSASTPKPGPVAHIHPEMTGAIRKLKDGYGFIAGDDGSDYFFHWSAMSVGNKNFRDLTVQERVVFQTIKTVEGKLRAISVRVI